MGCLGGGDNYSDSGGNSFVPVARIVERQPHLLKQAKLDEQTEWAKYENMTLSTKAKANIHHKAHTGLRIYHYHTDHLGTPQELTNDRGEVVWLNYQMAWGGSFSQLNNVHNLDGLDVSADELQPFRFQGQFFDGETGLHYNRFRYYDSDVGMFISRDPIELLGGLNVFAYAPNPVGWIDPYGLSKFKPVTFPPEQVIEQVTIAMQGSRKRDFKEANRVAGLNGVRGKPTQNAHRDTHGEVTWHHVDYDPVTNTATMQLVTEADHEAKIPHSGSVSEFETTHGVTYGTPEAKKYAKDLNTKLGNNCV